MALINAARVQIATVIDLQMQPLIETRADDLTVLSEMRGAMAGFKLLMETAGPAEMQSLMQRFVGRCRFAQVLERIAVGIQSGDITVPK